MGPIEITAGGRVRVVTTQLLPNGKLAVRVDGRIAGPPLLPEDNEASFLVDGQLFLLTRDGEEIRVEPIAEPPEDALPEIAPTRLPRRDVDEQLMPRAILFIVAGTIWLIGSAVFITIANTAATRMQSFATEVAQVEGAPVSDAVRSIVWIRRIVTGALRTQVITGGVIVLGAILMLNRIRSSPLIIEIGVWCAVASSLITFVVFDTLSHRALVLSYNAKAAAIGIARWHMFGFIFVMIFALIAGAMLEALNRERMSDLLSPN